MTFPDSRTHSCIPTNKPWLWIHFCSLQPIPRINILRVYFGLFWGIRNHNSPFLDGYIHNRNDLFPAEPSELTLASGKSVTLRSNHHCHVLVMSEWRPCECSSEWMCRIWHEADPWETGKALPLGRSWKASPSLGPSTSAYERLTRACKNSNSSVLLVSVLYAIHTLRSSVIEMVGAPPPECTSLPVLSLCLYFLHSVTALSQSSRAKLCYLLTTESRNAVVILKVKRKKL